MKGTGAKVCANIPVKPRPQHAIRGTYDAR
jgi:hypothetical protein